MGMRPDDHHHSLYVPGDDRGDGSAYHPQLRETEFTEYQQIIQGQVHQHGHHARQHGHLRLAALPQGAGIHFLYDKRRQPGEHHPQIRFPVLQRSLQGQVVALPVQIHLYQLLPTGGQHQRAQHQNPQAYINLEPQRVADALVVLTAEKLGAENAHARYRAENSQAEYHQQLVHDGYAGHLLRPDAPYHDVVQQPYKVGDPVLNHDGHCHAQYFSVERLVAD